MRSVEKRDRANGGATDSSGPGANNSRAIGGYDAYFGNSSVDDATNTVTQRLVGSPSAERVGLVVTREMRIDGDQLVISVRTTVGGVPVHENADVAPRLLGAAWRTALLHSTRLERSGV